MEFKRQVTARFPDWEWEFSEQGDPLNHRTVAKAESEDLRFYAYIREEVIEDWQIQVPSNDVEFLFGETLDEAIERLRTVLKGRIQRAKECLEILT